MLTSAIVTGPGFDAGEFEKAFRAANFDRCRELIESRDDFDAVLAGALLALRERRYAAIIADLAEVPKCSAEVRVARDVLLGAALALTRDYVGGSRLIERALSGLKVDTRVVLRGTLLSRPDRVDEQDHSVAKPPRWSSWRLRSEQSRPRTDTAFVGRASSRRDPAAGR